MRRISRHRVAPVVFSLNEGAVFFSLPLWHFVAANAEIRQTRTHIFGDHSQVFADHMATASFIHQGDESLFSFASIEIFVFVRIIRPGAKLRRSPLSRSVTLRVLSGDRQHFRFLRGRCRVDRKSIPGRPLGYSHCLLAASRELDFRVRPEATPFARFELASV